MNENLRSNSSQQHQLESEEPDLPELNGLQRLSSANSHNSILPIINNANYTRINKKQEILDVDAIINLYEQNSIGKIAKQQASLPAKKLHKKPSKIGTLTQKVTSGFDYLKKKYEQTFDQIIQKFKKFLTDFRRQYDSRQKQVLFQLFKYLSFGIFELKQHHQKPNHDMTKNEVKIIHPQTDLYQWIKRIVQQFELQFKIVQNQVKVGKSSINIRQKWDQLIKNCRDQTNFNLRRRIIRKKITAMDVLSNGQSFLLSQQALRIKQRQQRLILAEAQQDLAQQAQLHDDQTPDFSQKSPSAIQLPQLSATYSSMKQINHHEDDLKKLNEYKLFLQNQSISRLKNRIIDVLRENDSFDRIMIDFKSKFE